jgi:hypothetical protein
MTGFEVAKSAEAERKYMKNNPVRTGLVKNAKRMAAWR